jgi:hypothetical protein
MFHTYTEKRFLCTVCLMIFEQVLVMPGVVLQATPWGPELGGVYMEAIQAIIRETRKIDGCNDFKLDVVGLTYEGYNGTGVQPHHHIYTNSRVVY